MPDREPPSRTYDYFEDLEQCFRFVREEGEMSDELAVLIAEELFKEFKEWARKNHQQNPKLTEIDYLTFICGTHMEGLEQGKGGPGGLKIFLALSAIRGKHESESSN